MIAPRRPRRPAPSAPRLGHVYHGPGLREELKLVRPEVLVILGATAGKALLGSKFTLRESRGRPVDSDLAPHVTATIHPSAILRAPDDEARSAERRAFARDLQTAADVLNR
jgi:uracil-DNA glycosylase family 4